jgi:hypothetical protein
LGLSKHGWGIDASNNSSIDNSPEDRINQFYVMFSVGASLLKPATYEGLYEAYEMIKVGMHKSKAFETI